MKLPFPSLSIASLLVCSSLFVVGCVAEEDELGPEVEDLEAAAPGLEVEAPEALVSPEDPEAWTCTSSCDCPGNFWCINGVCQVGFGPFSLDSCISNCQCDYGGECINGECDYTQSSCSTSCDCALGTVCIGGTCLPDFGPAPECHCDAQCANNEVCAGGLCFASGGGGGGGIVQ